MYIIHLKVCHLIPTYEDDTGHSDKVLDPLRRPLADFSDVEQGVCKNTKQKGSRAWSNQHRDGVGFSHPPSFLQMNLPDSVCVFLPKAEPADEGCENQVEQTSQSLLIHSTNIPNWASTACQKPSPHRHMDATPVKEIKDSVTGTAGWGALSPLFCI